MGLSKEKQDRLAQIKADKKKKLDNKVVESMGVVVSDDEAPEVKVVRVEPVYSANKEMQSVATRIYNQVIEKVNYALKKKGVQIGAYAEFETVKYADKNYMKTIKKMGEDGWIFVFHSVDPNKGHEKTGMVFQRVLTKAIKVKAN